jgi:hypothetical protein
VRHPFSPRRTIIFGALTVGTVDILWAFAWSAVSGNGPINVLQSVAGGALGQASFEGGLATALLGMFIHFFIATCVVTTYYLASRRYPELAQRPWLYGPLYGICVYLVMNEIVLPLSAYHTTGIHFTKALAKGLFIHMFGIGLITALFARRGSPPPA